MPTTMKVTTPDEARGPVVAHLFDKSGALLERVTVTNGAVKLRANQATILAGRLMLAPDVGKEVTPSMLQRARAFEPLIGATVLPDVIELPPSIVIHWPWCVCVIKGRVERSDGRPVCDARVHICEVDSIPQLVARLPDRDIARLRDDLLDLIAQPPLPPPIRVPDRFPDPFPDLFPGPRPGPDPSPIDRRAVTDIALRRDLNSTVVASSVGSRAVATPLDRRTQDTTAIELDPRVRAQLTSQAIPTVRKTLAARPDLILPWLCRWSWLWPWLTCDDIAVIQTGDGGQFQQLYFHDCSDTPDLYFWVEYDFGDGWETVHRPSMACNVHWNHDCTDEVVVTVKDPRVPSCAGTPTGNHDVNILSLGRNVAVREVRDASAGPSTEGLTTDGAPFGATIEPRVDFSPSLDAAGIAWYRWSARRLSGPDGVTATAPAGSVPINSWFPLTRNVVRHYREVTPSGTSFPSMVLGPLPAAAAPAPNLFQIPPVMTPAGDAQWRVLDEREDLASAHFETASMLGSPTSSTTQDLAAGRYELKLELFDTTGSVVNWTDAGIEAGITDQNAPFGTGAVTTSPAPVGNRIVDGSGDTVGFTMVIRVDNSRCEATVHPPVGDLALGPCGFHQYALTSDNVGLSFDAAHPNGLARWAFDVVRGTDTPPTIATSATGAVGQSGPGDWTLTGQTHSNNVITVDSMLGSCDRAAFSQRLRVAALAQNGYGRLSAYDATDHGGFALITQD